MGEGNKKRGYKVIRETEGKSIKGQQNQGNTTRQSNQADSEMTFLFTVFCTKTAPDKSIRLFLAWFENCSDRYDGQ